MATCATPSLYSLPTLNCYDELAYYTSESSRRMFEEGISSLARQISFRLSVSTAGFENESSPLRDLYDRAMKHGTEIEPDLWVHENLLLYWTHQLKAPWQYERWVENEKRSLRPAQFARLILNQWVTSETRFLNSANGMRSRIQISIRYSPAPACQFGLGSTSACA
jgi:hypothetical protein